MKQKITIAFLITIVFLIPLIYLNHARADFNDYQYMAFPYNTWSSCSSTIIRWKVYAFEDEELAWANIGKCDGTPFVKNGLAEIVLISTGEVVAQQNYSAGSSLLSVPFDPYGEFDAIGRNAYEVRLHPENDPTTLITGSIDVWVELATSVEAQRNGDRWTDVQVCYNTPGGSACGNGYYDKRYLTDGDGPWDFYTEKQTACSIELSDNSPYNDASFESYNDIWWYIVVPVAGMDVVVDYVCDTTPPDNLLQNSSFEQGNNPTPPWKWLDTTCNRYAYQDASIAFDGSYYLATNKNNSTTCKSFYQDITGTPNLGGTYTFRIMARSSNGVPRQGEIVIWALGGQQEKSTTSFSLSATTWTEIQTSLTIQRNDHHAIRAEIYLHSLDGIDYYFDSAYLSVEGGQPFPTPTPPPTIYDSDHDGISDSDEINGWINSQGFFITDPSDWDTDDGGLSDGAEKANGTIPYFNVAENYSKYLNFEMSGPCFGAECDDRLPDIMARVNKEELMNTLYSLDGSCNLPPVPGWPDYRIESRGHHENYRSPNGINFAREYLKQFFESKGLDVTIQEFYNNGKSRKNLIVCLTPTCTDGAGERPIVLLTAHYDSIAGVYDSKEKATIPENILAPGANDNASGVATVMMAAQVLKDYSFVSEIRLVLFDGEEENGVIADDGILGYPGQLGSQEYKNFLEEHDILDRVSAVINLDMIGYGGAVSPNLHLRCAKDGVNDWLYQRIDEVSKITGVGYLLEIQPESDPDSCMGSDQWAFRRVPPPFPGMKATMGDFPAYQIRDIQATIDEIGRPGWMYNHKATDKANIIAPDYYTAVARTSIGLLASLAGIHETTVAIPTNPTNLSTCNLDLNNDPLDFINTENQGSNGAISIGNFTETTVDLNNNELDDLLQFNTTITVTTPSTYTINATLCDNFGEAIDTFGAFAFLNKTDEISISFDGQNLYQVYIDSYVSLCELEIRSSSIISETLIQSNAYTSTQSYYWPNFETSAIRLSTTHLEQSFDDDGDGYTDHIEVIVPIEINAVGIFSDAISNTVRLVGYLTEGETVIGVDEKNVVIELDTQNLQMEFEGQSIYGADADGPYSLIVGIDVGSDEVGTVDDTTRTYQTQEYSAAQFEPPSVIFDQDFIDYGVDIDGDGIFDQLAIETQVQVIDPGNYTIGAKLGKNSIQVAPWAMNTLFLPTGQSTVTFYFDAGAISGSGLEAPFTLEVVEIFNAETHTRVQRLSQAYTTSNYNSNEFENSETGITLIYESNLYQPVDFTSSWGPITLMPGEIQPFVNLLPGMSYYVTVNPETLPGSSWELINVSCLDTQGQVIPITVDLENMTVTIPLQDEQNLTCTFQSSSAYEIFLPLMKRDEN